MISDHRQGTGQRGEQLACEHLSRLGYEIVERNYRTRWGELDIIARTGTALVFCEVKTLRVTGRGDQPLEAVDPAKRRRVRKMAARWLVERRPRAYAEELRFDAIGVTVDDADRLVALEHVEGAF
jgi:putative endonuclease